MKNIAPISLCIILLLCSYTLSGQKGWTLEMCIEYGLQNSLDVESTKLQYKQGEISHIGSYMELLPEIQHQTGWSIHPQPHLTSYLDISLGIFNGMAKINNINLKSTSLEMYGQEIRQAKYELKISITQAFLDLLIAQEMVTMGEESYKGIREQYIKSEALFRGGRITHSSLLEIGSQKSSEWAKLVEYRSTLSYRLLHLKQLINFPYSEDLFIVPDHYMVTGAEVPTLNVEEIFTKATELPYITIAKLDILREKYSAKILYGGAMPLLSFNMSIDIPNRMSTLGFHITLPIFNRGTLLTEIRNANLNIKHRELELEKRYRNLYREIDMATLQARTCYEQYTASLDQVSAMEESFKYAQKEFDLGLLTPFDYNYTRNQLLKARSESIQAKYKYLFQLKIIDYYQGETE